MATNTDGFTPPKKKAGRLPQPKNEQGEILKVLCQPCGAPPTKEQRSLPHWTCGKCGVNQNLGYRNICQGPKGKECDVRAPKKVWNGAISAWLQSVNNGKKSGDGKANTELASASRGSQAESADEI